MGNGKWLPLNSNKINARMKPIQLNKEPTPELVTKLIEQHIASNAPRFIKLQNYYEGYNDILNRVKDDPTKTNKKIVSGYPS